VVPSTRNINQLLEGWIPKLASKDKWPLLPSANGSENAPRKAVNSVSADLIKDTGTLFFLFLPLLHFFFYMKISADVLLPAAGIRGRRKKKGLCKNSNDDNPRLLPRH
jgi:hypothetical protein